MKIRSAVFAAILAINPLMTVLAQGTSPGTKADSATESTAMKDGSATNSHESGATGATFVPGNKSNVAGDQKATAETKAGSVAGGK
jgi:hypothetical protein